MLTSLLLLACSTQLGEGRPAPAPQLSDLTALLEPLREEHGLPALAAAIVTSEGLVAVGAAGLRSSGAEAEVTPADLWHLGSCTKAMTATLTARLVERELLGWDTTVGEALPALREAMDPAWRDVSIRLLLAHRGGAPAQLDSGGLWLRLRAHEGTPREQRRTLVEAVLRSPPEVPPGTRYLYSNAGYALAGAMLESLADEPWEELLRREVFVPLGMDSAGFGSPGTAAALDQPWGHRPGRTAPHPVAPGPRADNPAAIAPAGTVHASLADWARFAAAHLRGAQGQGDYLSPQTWHLLHTPLEGQDYALGWVSAQRPWAGGPALTHSGSNTMWFCTIWLAPERGFGVLAAANLGGEAASEACDQACGALIRDRLAHDEERR